MGAEIIDLAFARMNRRPAALSIAPATAAANLAMLRPAPPRNSHEARIEAAGRFHFWTGASGKRYVHTVYSLFDCPPLDAGNYILVRRSAPGQTSRAVLAIGRLSDQAATLNLAEIRQRAATLGADEVHVHLLATSSQEAQAVETDLRTAQFAAAR